jgi:hypothetical protein
MLECLVTGIRRAAFGVSDIIVGGDWLTAAGVVIALAVTALIAGADLAAWWLIRVAVLALLGLSLARARR